jgi:hypothetical protein
MKISTKMMKGILGFIGVLFLLVPLTVFAGDDLMMMITPALSGNRPLRNVITVAKGNGKFTDPVAALNPITDASATNPYLVVIGPGVYTVYDMLFMKPYVDIVGSGENMTKITGAISGQTLGTSTIVRGSNNSALSSLTVENTGGSGTAIALYNGNASPRVTNVTAIVSGGPGQRIGVYNNNGSSTVMTDVTATASGSGGNNYGVYNGNSSSTTMTRVSATGLWGTTNYGVYNDNYSCPTMTDVTATAAWGTSSYGVFNYDSSPVIRRSTMRGLTHGLHTDFGTTTVSQSTIINGASGATNNKCVACDNGSGTALNATCN